MIFDRCGPSQAEDMPRGQHLLHRLSAAALEAASAATARSRTSRVEKLANPHVKDWMRKHSIMRYLPACRRSASATAFRIDVKDLPPRTPRLLETDRDTALLFTPCRASRSPTW